MVNFILGRSGYGKTELIKKLILKELDSGNNNIILIIPEQSSFETEKNILEFLGNKNFAKIKILNFSNLSSFVFEKLNMPDLKPVNNIKQIIILNNILEELSPQLEIYKKSSSNINFIELLLKTIQELKSNKVTLEDLDKILELSKKELLKQKIRELKLIYHSFNNICHEKFQNCSNILNLTEKLLKDHKIFENYTVFVDEFDGFDMQQFDILEYIITQSQDTYMSFCTDRTDYYLFENINQTIKKIINISQKNNVEHKIFANLTQNMRAQNEELKILEQNIFRPNKIKNHKTPENIFFSSSHDIHGECEKLVQNIKDIIISKKYHYRDIVILLRNSSEYPDIIKSLLKKDGINYFLDFPEKLFNKNITNLILAIFDIIINNYNSQDIIKLLKTNLINISQEDVYLLENYVLLWKIKSKSWFSEFTMHPDGFYSQFEQKDIELLEKINQIREKIITPIYKFHQKNKNSTGKEISIALYELILEFKVPEKFREFCCEISTKNNIEVAEKYAFIWSNIIDVLNQVAETIGDQKIKLEKYAEIFKFSLNTVDCSYVPQNSDSILITSVERARIFDKKVVFIVGAVSGEFPKDPEFSEIFNINEINYINSLGVNLNKNLEKSLITERFLVYKSLSCVSDMIFVSWHTSEPSEIIHEIKNIFPNTKFYNKNILENQELSEQEINIIKIFLDKNKFNFNNKLKTQELFGNNLVLSASQIEKYFTCKFWYFCQYGLNLKYIQETSFKNLDYGNIVHFLLEILIQKYVKHKKYLNLEQELDFDINNLLSDYVNKNFMGLDNKSKLFIYKLSKIKITVKFLINYFIEEFNQSKFQVLETEFKTPELKLDIMNKKTVSIIGKIDRIDTMNLNNQTYFRIIDYKTSSKEFKLSNILDGMNMQMLIYLLAVSRNNNNMLPAGVLYFKALRPILEAKNINNIQKLSQELDKSLKMNGLIVENKDVILGMEPESQGKYIPVLLKNDEIKSSECTVNPNELDIIFNYIENKIKHVSNKIFDGNFSPRPIVLNNNNSCEFCNFKNICLNNKNNIKNTQNLSKSESIDIMKNYNSP